jgi:hypothetical protein
LHTGTKAIVVLFIAGEGVQVTQIRAMMNPAKLRRL